LRQAAAGDLSGSSGSGNSNIRDIRSLPVNLSFADIANNEEALLYAHAQSLFIRQVRDLLSAERIRVCTRMTPTSGRYVPMDLGRYTAPASAMPAGE
jgi:hypothetical protein